MTEAWVDGRFVESADVPVQGVGAFETLGAYAGTLPLWDRHMARLNGAAQRLEIEPEPPAGLREAAHELLRRRGHGDDILRVTLLAGAVGRGSWLLTTRQREVSHGPVTLRAVPLAPQPNRQSAGIKSIERAGYDAALRKALATGADDALLHDADGRVLETSTCNVFFGAPDGVVTPPLGFGIIPGVARGLLLEGLANRGFTVAERSVTLTDLRAWGTIVVTNAVYGPRPAVLAEIGAAIDRTAGGFCDTLSQIWREALARCSAPGAGPPHPS